MNKSILLLIGAAAILGSTYFQNQTQDAPLQSLFSEWKVKYNQKFDTPQEEAYRFAVFQDNKKKIDTNNAAGYTHKEALNQFSALTKEEFKARYLSGYQPTEQTLAPLKENSKAEIPQSWDWTKHGAVTGIKNQGECGSCWAFGTVGGIEGEYKLSGHTLTSFSEQQICSCDPNDMGCMGGNLPPAYEYVHGKGLETEADYPYEGWLGIFCNYDESKTVIKTGQISGHAVTVDSKSAYLSALSEQPLSICVAASAFQSYSSGILSTACDTSVDHCVTGVGYDLTGSVPYTKIKNSWGASWGEEGFVQVSVADDAPKAGYCSIYSVPTAAKFTA